ncbi:deoxyribonuclease-2-alpha isoform X1 [Echeneis naucrates]|uniref:Deoxyribonuclease-2-alpha n=1 Tax=Echeneis naucrates TaxID=173247 RepID=A0A665WFX5_ECHNA|nr:deoxyribonuclease-2-beta isoform X1 [Echeneis naucrates]
MNMATQRTALCFLLSVWVLFQGCDSDVKCRNDKGEEVDWYVIYKFNRSLSYNYMDESTKGWKLSQKTVDSKRGALANTLKPLLDFYDNNTKDFGFILYNDQPNNKCVASSSYGHSKGVVLLDNQTIVWLTHSTPNFPKNGTKDFWPESGKSNAQTFMCVTFPFSAARDIALQLYYIHPYCYDHKILPTLPHLLNLVPQRNSYPPEEPWYNVGSLTSLNGKRFLRFAKYKRFNGDLYSDLIVKNLREDLYVKSWKNKVIALPSTCEINNVYNVNALQFPRMRKYHETVDHSKWCVTIEANWTCIADMNRAGSQKKRGGGALCIDDPKVSKAFRHLVKEFEPCPPQPHTTTATQPPKERVRKSGKSKVKPATQTVKKECFEHE